MKTTHFQEISNKEMFNCLAILKTLVLLCISINLAKDDKNCRNKQTNGILRPFLSLLFHK